MSQKWVGCHGIKHSCSAVPFKDFVIFPLLNKHAHNMHTLILYLYISAKYYSSSYEFKGVYIFSYLCLHVLWGKMCMREAPDPANSQGLVEDDSSETWTSWLSTCSPAQRTLLTACMVGKCTNKVKVRPLAVMMTMSLEEIRNVSVPVRMGLCYVHL